MSEPWAVSKVAQTLTADIDPEGRIDRLTIHGTIHEAVIYSFIPEDFA